MSKEHVEALCKKAAEAKDSGDAMRFSQAAVNVANAKIVTKNTETKE